MNYDIAIIGSGPAGATLARLLSKKLKVIVIDKKNHSGAGGFKKPCGGLLAPDAQKLIGEFGLELPKDILVTPQIFAVSTVDIKEEIMKYYNRFYLNFNRHKFDLWLCSMMPSWVKVEDEAFCSSISKTDAGFSIEYKKQGKAYNATARYIVGADGAKSVVRESFFSIPIRQYLCIQKSYKAVEHSPYYVCFFDERLTDCYGWINIKDGVAQLGAALPIKTAKEDFIKIEKYFIQKGYDLSSLINTEACLVNRPKKIREIALHSNGAFLVGEAAGYVSPSSLEGISLAFDSAVILAESFNDNINAPQKRYFKKSRKLKLRLFTKIMKSWVLYTPWLRRLVMKIGITTIKPIKPPND